MVYLMFAKSFSIVIIRIGSKATVMIKLSVNVNKIALLRNARSLDLNLPDLCEAVRAIVKAGADGITVHPRPDQRHIKYDDAYKVADLLKSEFQNIEYNIEGNPFTGRYMEIASKIIPKQATLVPDMPGANTSDHGWDLNEGNRKRLAPIIAKLKDLGIRISLFINADTKTAKLAKEVGAGRVELYTEPYARAFREEKMLKQTIKRYADAAKAAAEEGFAVNAGHDLNQNNLQMLCTEVPQIVEVSIGHALIADALYDGLDKTVKKYLKILSTCSEHSRTAVRGD